MKKILFVALIIVCSLQMYAGCDMCSMYLGLNPNYNNHTIGLRFKYSLYSDKGMHHNMTSEEHQHHGGNEIEAPSKYKREYQTTELFAIFYPSPKIQVMAFVPYMSNNVYKEKVWQENHTGLGDISFLGRYQLFNTSNDTGGFRQRVFAGAGIKFPTGTYNEISADGMLDPHIQLGTGSTDILFSVSYLCKYAKFGFNTDFNYRLNSANKHQYCFADRFSNTSSLFYTISQGKFVFIPGIGIYTEMAGYDIDHKIEMTTTNGTVLNSTFSMDIYLSGFSLNLNYHLPLNVQLNDPDADHQGRAMAGLNYSF
jgi:hypothetical protein